jgi:hypothetical protein
VRAALTGALLGLATLATAEPRLVIGGRVDTASPLLVVLDLHNAGDAEARDVEVEGELVGEIDRARRHEPLAGGGRAPLALSFPRLKAAPGVHALALTVDYKDLRGAARTQRAWLLLSLGSVEAPPAGLRLDVPETPIGTSADVKVTLTSTDREARRVRVRLLPPRGLQVLGPPATVDVPAEGHATAHIQLLRSGAARPSTQGIVVLAEWEQGGRAAALGTAATVRVEADPAVLPRVRRALVAAGAALLLFAAWAELRRFRNAGSSL